VTQGTNLLVLIVFAAVYLGIALGRWPGLRIDRTGIALLGAIVLYVGGVVDGPRAVDAIDFPTLILLFGLMVLSSQYAACGFYAWCSRRIARTPWGPQRLLALTVVTAGLLSAVLANDVVVFAMTPLLVTGIQRRGLDPKPFVIALASAANAGSAATLIGNPQNILIGQVGGLEFWPFLVACGPPALVGLLCVQLVIAWLWRGRLELAATARTNRLRARSPLDPKGLRKAVFYTVIPLALFATPLPQVEGVLLVTAGLLVSRSLATHRMLGQVDWHLLVLFASLFIVTAALGSTGLPAEILAGLTRYGMAPDDPILLAPLTVVGSNTIGNVPLIVLLLSVLPAPAPATLHGLAVISTLAGNLLLVGSLANIIAVERARDVGGEHRLPGACASRHPHHRALARGRARLALALAGVISSPRRRIRSLPSPGRG
jgi:Na+/H+ antiporter NhaD/arsenite permease-like protein